MLETEGQGQSVRRAHRTLHPNSTRERIVSALVLRGRPDGALTDVLRDLFGLDMSEGALINILSAAREAFAAQTSPIKERLLSGTALASDETGLRVGKVNWWLWVFHHGDIMITHVVASYLLALHAKGVEPLAGNAAA